MCGFIISAIMLWVRRDHPPNGVVSCGIHFAHHMAPPAGGEEPLSSPLSWKEALAEACRKLRLPLEGHGYPVDTCTVQS